MLSLYRPRRRASFSTKCVQFAPTGRGWAAASTEGLLIYSLDDFVMFNPFELDESVTPDAAREASLAGEHARALLVRARPRLLRD